jgi:hypothetical protein
MLVLPDGRIFPSSGEDAVVISRLPAECVRTDLIEFTNHPEDDISIHILRLLSIHLRYMDDEQKQAIVKTINEQLDITMS